MFGRIAALALLLAGCSQSIVTPPMRADRQIAPDREPDDASSDDDAAIDRDAALVDDLGRVFFDAMLVRPDAAAPFDVGVDVGVPVPDGGVLDLDPQLALPDPAGGVCFSPGSLSECPGIDVCRFYTSIEGRCESCSPCGNLGARCTRSDECDILFMCFRGACVNFCDLGTQACGADDCQDIGHPTKGVCPD